VGDDLTVTNPVKIKRAVDEKAANALLLKVLQHRASRDHPHARTTRMLEPHTHPTRALRPH
jgi:hypothetical protein